MAALSPAQRQAKMRERVSRKLKSFNQFMAEIGHHHTMEAGRIVSELCEQLQIKPNEVTALFKDCFKIESNSHNHMCESIVRMRDDRQLQATFWRFLQSLERWHDKNINRVIDKRIKELKEFKK